MEKETVSKIKKKKSVLTKLYKNLPTDRLTLAKDLIERAAYMMVKLEEMEEIIDRDGLMMKMDQGKYDIDRAHPLLASYTTMVKSYNSTIKQLNEFLPPTDAAVAGQALMTFATKPRVTTRTR